MKTQLVILTVTCSILLLGCKKKTPPADPDVPAPVAPTTVGFHWNENGGQYLTADSAKWDNYAEGTGLRVYKDSNYYFFEVIWKGDSNTTVGSKTVSASSLNFSYERGTDIYAISSSQTVNITAFNNDLLSGNFNMSVFGSGSVNKIDAVFKDVRKRN